MNLGMVLRDLSQFPESQTHLLAAEKVLGTATGAPSGRHAQCVDALIKLYEKWNIAESDKGYDAKAADWRDRLDEFNARNSWATSRPT